MKKEITNMAISIREQLKHKARVENRPYNELLQYFAMERFLYRLSKSQYSDIFILKGALMLQVWQSHHSRPTMDIDMLAKTDNSEDNLSHIIKNIINTPVDNDGLNFISESITTKIIKEEADYHGVRILFHGTLDTAKIHMQIDIGFDDIVYPDKEQQLFPALLSFSQPLLYIYSRESVIAEKFEAMVKLGYLNSRMKDFYDIWHLLNQFNFDEEKLTEAIRLTFEHRRTILTKEIIAFSDSYIAMKQVQWIAFIKKMGQKEFSVGLDEVVQKIKTILQPIVFKIIKTGEK